MFFYRNRENRTEYINTQGKVPVIRASICTGEKVAGFRDPRTGIFEDVMLIQKPGDLDTFCSRYHLRQEDIKTIY